MSNRDEYDPNQASGAGQGRADAGPAGDPDGQAAADGHQASSSELICQAEDLKGLLQQIAHQISDADRRHGDALQAMQERLAAIGDQAEQVKTSVPDEFRPAFERIEEAVSQLGERITLAARQRHTRLQTATDVTGQAPQQPQAPQQFDHGADAPADTAMDNSEASPGAAAAQQLPDDVNEQFERELAALKETVLVANGRSQDKAEAAPALSAAKAGSSSAIVEPGPAMASSIAADPTQPWDADSVDALVGLYAAGPEGLPPPPPAPPPLSSSQAAVAEPTDSQPSLPAPPTGRSGLDQSLQDSKIDQQWLEARFADVAARVEMSLADMKPDYTMDVLGERFDRFEEHLGNALHDVATRNDMAGLGSIEAQVAELTGHLEHTQSQLTRLDGIEDGIAAIVSQLSKSQDSEDKGIADLQDLSSLAETVATKVAGSIHDGQSNDRTEAQFDDLRDMLSSYMSEQREGDKNTSGALDTMQAALIHLVERVDAMESNVASAAAAPGFAQAAVQSSAQAAAQSSAQVGGQAGGAAGTLSAAAQMSAASVHAEPQEYVREAVRFKVDHRAEPELPLAGAEGHEGQAGGEPEFEKIAGEAARMAHIAAEAAAAHQPPRGALAASATPAQQQSSDESLYGKRTMPDTALRGSPRPRVSSVSAPSGKGSDGREGKADYIEQARHAQRLAGERKEQEERDEQANAASSGSIKSRLAMATRKAGQARQAGRAGSAAGGETKAKGLPRSLLVACAALAVVTMGTLLYGKMSSGARPMPAIEKKIVPPRGHKAAMKRNSGKVTASAAKALPAGKSSAATIPPRSMPEIVTNHPGLGETDSTSGEVIENSSPLKDSRLLNGRIPGITLHKSRRPLSAAALSRLDRRNRMARASSRISMRDDLAPRATKISLHPGSATVFAPNASAGAGSQAVSSQALNMPPALIGPLSLRLAAAKGDPSAEFEVAARFAEGKGIKQNYDAAAKWYQRSAARGFAPAQYRLGTLYERGMGVKTDLSRARIWYLRAAKQGNVKAMHNLAVLSAGRVGSRPDYATAVQWFTEAGERGLADSQFNLGILYQSGLGAKRDLTTSYKWFSLAAARGDKQAIHRRDDLRARMSPAQLASAERMVRGWHQTPVETLVNDPRAAGQAWLGHGVIGTAGRAR